MDFFFRKINGKLIYWFEPPVYNWISILFRFFFLSLFVLFTIWIGTNLTKQLFKSIFFGLLHFNWWNGHAWTLLISCENKTESSLVSFVLLLLLFISLCLLWPIKLTVLWFVGDEHFVCYFTVSLAGVDAEIIQRYDNVSCLDSIFLLLLVVFTYCVDARCWHYYLAHSFFFFVSCSFYFFSNKSKCVFQFLKFD